MSYLKHWKVMHKRFSPLFCLGVGLNLFSVAGVPDANADPGLPPGVGSITYGDCDCLFTSSHLCCYDRVTGSSWDMPLDSNIERFSLIMGLCAPKPKPPVLAAPIAPPTPTKQLPPTGPVTQPR